MKKIHLHSQIAVPALASLLCLSACSLPWQGDKTDAADVTDGMAQTTTTDDQATEETADDGDVTDAQQATGSYIERATEIVDSLTVEQMAAATIMPSGDVSGILTDFAHASDADIERLSQEGWFGLLLTTPNIETPDQLRELTDALHRAGSSSAVGVPFALSVDEEGGLVRRVSGKDGIGIDAEQSASDLGATGDENLAYESGRRIGAYLADLGFDIDFAPVADVRTDSCDATMSSRCFSDSADGVATMALAQLRGLAESGVAGCLKHYPGLGPTYGDSHEESVTSNKSLEELLSWDLVPYAKASEEGIAPMVMVGHILTPSLTDDGLPASLSPSAISILRNDLGYDGLVITDSLGMQAALDAYPQDDLAWHAIAAGADVALMPVDAGASRDAMVGAVERGDLDEARLRDAAVKSVAMRIALSEGDANPWD